MWKARYEEENKELNIKDALLLNFKNEYNEQTIKLQQTQNRVIQSTRQVDVLTTQNKKFQKTINQTVSKAESTERELATIREVMR